MTKNAVNITVNTIPGGINHHQIFHQKGTIVSCCAQYSIYPKVIVGVVETPIMLSADSVSMAVPVNMTKTIMI